MEIKSIKNNLSQQAYHYHREVRCIVDLFKSPACVVSSLERGGGVS
jgi:hypothetical protein